jgi:transposase
VLTAVRTVNRLELVGETLRAALNDSAGSAPEWLQALTPQEWFERYERRIEEARLPKQRPERDAYTLVVGNDGFALLDAVDKPDTPHDIKDLTSIAILRKVWEQQYERIDGEAHWRNAEKLAPNKERLHSPYEVDMTYSIKGNREWLGYKVHLTETCDADTPHLITDVQTTQAHVPDVSMTETIERDLETRGLPPSDPLLDSGYTDVDLLIEARNERGINIIESIILDPHTRKAKMLCFIAKVNT